jgi:hypothetical protein
VAKKEKSTPLLEYLLAALQKKRNTVDKTQRGKELKA